MSASHCCDVIYKMGALISMFVFLAAPVRSEPLMLQCKFIEGTRGGSYAANVNQIAVDLDKETLDFRAAETLGTTNPVNYKFENKGLDRLAVSKQPNGLVAGGIRFGTPFGITID